MAEETKQKTKNIPMGLYFSFLREEIPDIIQITTLLGFLGVLLRDVFLSKIIPPLITILLWQYLIEKAHKFLKNQITNPYSKVNLLADSLPRVK